MNTLLAKLCSHLGLKPEHTALLNERDTSDVWRQFAIWLLVDEEYGVIGFTRRGSQLHKVIQQVAQLYIEDCKDRKRWKAAKDAAWSVDAYEAYAATDAAAATDAGYAGYAAAAAEAASSAAFYAAYAYAAAAAAAYAAAASAAHYERMANKLIKLLQAAPLKETI